MKTLQKTLLIAGGTVIGIAVAGGMFAYENGHFGRFSDDETITTAIKAHDYTQLSDEAKNKITEDKFEHMVEHNETREAVQTAITNSDYDAFVEAADERMLDRIEDQEDFDEMVARHQARATHQQAIQTAVAANNFAAFEAAMESHRAELDALDDDHQRHRPELTDEQQQKKFQKLVDYYKENGELPQREHGHMKEVFGHDRDGKDGCDKSNERNRRGHNGRFDRD